MKKIVIAILMLILPCIVLSGCNSKPSPVAIRAVWWWSSNLEEEVIDEYLNFAYDNGINSIYYCSSEFGEKTNGFIEKAKKKNMKVYWLDGYYKWLTSDTYQAQLFDKIDKYLDYNANYPDNAFSGVHLDIEPHQSPDFKTNREDLILKLIALADKLKQTYKTINFTYDIPFWLHDEIEYNGVTKPAYAHMIDIADNITVMSYRDNADKIYLVASQELAYALSVNKTIILSVECGKEEDVVTFYEEGKTVLNTQLNRLYPMLPQYTGMAIHNITSWYNLAD